MPPFRPDSELESNRAKGRAYDRGEGAITRQIDTQIKRNRDMAKAIILGQYNTAPSDFDVKDIKAKDALGNPTKQWTDLQAEQGRLRARIKAKTHAGQLATARAYSELAGLLAPELLNEITAADAARATKPKKTKKATPTASSITAAPPPPILDAPLASPPSSPASTPQAEPTIKPEPEDEHLTSSRQYFFTMPEDNYPSSQGVAKAATSNIQPHSHNPTSSDASPAQQVASNGLTPASYSASSGHTPKENTTPNRPGLAQQVASNQTIATSSRPSLRKQVMSNKPASKEAGMSNYPNPTMQVPSSVTTLKEGRTSSGPHPPTQAASKETMPMESIMSSAAGVTADVQSSSVSKADTTTSSSEGSTEEAKPESQESTSSAEGDGEVLVSMRGGGMERSKSSGLSKAENATSRPEGKTEAAKSNLGPKLQDSTSNAPRDGGLTASSREGGSEQVKSNSDANLQDFTSNAQRAREVSTSSREDTLEETRSKFSPEPQESTPSAQHEREGSTSTQYTEDLFPGAEQADIADTMSSMGQGGQVRPDGASALGIGAAEGAAQDTLTSKDEGVGRVRDATALKRGYSQVERGDETSEKATKIQKGAMLTGP
ncbi:hypothetical protein LTR36_002218 [Oleoguttula mirabilis]|uniref:Uncharacterized protein n=1 Tax=Oleoguttula mirabilis TaxID=1507867 RepID=A0AAV9JL58_9PEZI|nr:hypothetical protein LTR36_002218 [Oleoguttula mirabilis]